MELKFHPVPTWIDGPTLEEVANHLNKIGPVVVVQDDYFGVSYQVPPQAPSRTLRVDLARRLSPESLLIVIMRLWGAHGRPGELTYKVRSELITIAETPGNYPIPRLMAEQVLAEAGTGVLKATEPLEAAIAAIAAIGYERLWSQAFFDLH
ncbi:MAG: hypothetical protein ACYDHP_00180 [Ferrimicrobium sp.]